MDQSVEMQSAFTAIFSVFIVIILVFGVISIVSYWKIFEKASKPGWAAIIPIYSTIVLLEIIKKPLWWLLLLLIPGVNLIFAIWATNLLSKSFGKNEGFTIGLLLLPVIFLPILAFDKSAQYIYKQNNEMGQIGLEA